MRLLFIVLTFGFSLQAHSSEPLSYYPDEFYDEVEDGRLRDAALKRELHRIIGNGHLSLGYTAARRLLFGELHLEQAPRRGYAVRDVYCEVLKVDREFQQRPPGPGLIPDPAVLNAEHTWPQSKFSRRFDRDLQKSDMHILFPVLAEANSARSNIPFSDVVTTVSSPCAPAKRGYSADGTSTDYFEVPDRHKGNVARAIFYFSVRYLLTVSAQEESSLRAWHRRDPVDSFERERNQKIFIKQKNRNPFIDHPEWVDLIGDF